MRSRKPFLIFWPQYFDTKRSRAEGRRLPKKLAIEKVNLDEIATVAKKLDYQTEIERVLKYPRTWWDEAGRILINTNGKKKSKVIKEIARQIRKNRGIN
ncbi:MAG: signal recognition particle protein Srp19 [Candidatus Lokiarchaeota archaeon]|nr:signal recognition particle protein Srp19 [Candidatus Lokiarchaeota archaeon]